jgi:hypothetical protein
VLSRGIQLRVEDGKRMDMEAAMELGEPLGGDDLPEGIVCA